MILQLAEIMAAELMAQHGLIKEGWTFRFDSSKTCFGRCWNGYRLITLSRHLVEINAEPEVRDTILHEIAHALCPADEHHGSGWKRMAASIGARPERCYSTERVKTPKADWTATCPRCARLHHRHTRLKDRVTLSCGPCIRTLGVSYKDCMLNFTRVASSEEDAKRFARNEASRKCKAAARNRQRTVSNFLFKDRD